MSEAENDTIRLQGLALGYPGRHACSKMSTSLSAAAN